MIPIVHLTVASREIKFVFGGVPRELRIVDQTNQMAKGAKIIAKFQDQLEHWATQK
jgi:hypothetical protein